LEDDSYLNLQIGNVKNLEGISFPQNATTDLSILALGFHLDHGNMQLHVEEISLGDNPIDLLNMNFAFTDEPYGFRSDLGELTLNISSIEDNYITGTISGNTETNELGPQQITGELYIKYQ